VVEEDLRSLFEQRARGASRLGERIAGEDRAHVGRRLAGVTVRVGSDSRNDAIRSTSA
jgi:hypothetical protein